MKVVITGITGLLGTELSNVLSNKHEVIGLLHLNTNINPEIKTHKVDISDQRATYNVLTKINPDIVIHSAALADVDKCEKDPDYAYKVNSIGTRNIALACQRFDTVMLYVSTDYVFSGKDGSDTPYKEFDKVDPINVYGESKLAGEGFVSSLLNKFFIVRTSWIFGELHPNFITQVIKSLKNNKSVKAAADMNSSPTYVKDLSQAIYELIDTNCYGAYHITNTGHDSRYNIAIRIAEMLKLPGNLIEKTTQKQLNLPAKRPVFSALNNYVWKLNGFKPLRNWQETMSEFIKNIT